MIFKDLSHSQPFCDSNFYTDMVPHQGLCYPHSGLSGTLLSAFTLYIVFVSLSALHFTTLIRIFQLRNFYLHLLKCVCKAINYFSYFSFPHAWNTSISFSSSVIKITLLPERPLVQRNVCMAFMYLSYTNCIQVVRENFRRGLTLGLETGGILRQNRNNQFYFLSALIMRNLYIVFSQNNYNNIIHLDYETSFANIKLTDAAPSLSVLIFYVAD